MTLWLLRKFHWSPKLLKTKMLDRCPLVVKGSLGISQVALFQNIVIQRTFFPFPSFLETWLPASAIRALAKEITIQKEWSGGGKTCLPTKGTKTLFKVSVERRKKYVCRKS